MIETRLSSQTGREQPPSHAVTNDGSLRVRLGPKHASVFGEQPDPGHSTGPETSANVQAPYTHRAKSVSAPSDVRAFYGDTPHEHAYQVEPHTRENTMQAMPSGPAHHVGGPHAHQGNAEGIDAAHRQQSSGGEDSVPANGFAVPGLRPLKQGTSTVRLRGSGWHGDEERGKSRKRSHVGKSKSQDHKSSHKRSKRSAGHGHHSEHHIATHPTGYAVAEQPRSPTRATVQSPHPPHEHHAGADRRQVYRSAPGNGHQEFYSDDDDDVIYMGIQARGPPTVMDLISDDDTPDVRLQPQLGEPAYAEEVIVMPVMETVHDDGGPVCRSAAIPAPQLQTFTQAEDVAPHTEAQPSAATKHDLQPPRDDDRHTKKRDRNSSPEKDAQEPGGAQGATATPTTTRRGDVVHRSDEAAHQEHQASRRHKTAAVSERSGHHDKSGKSSRGRSKHSAAHESSRDRTDAADRDRGDHRPQHQRVRDDEGHSRPHKRSHHDAHRSPRGREQERERRGRRRSAEVSRSPKKGDNRRRRSPRAVPPDDERQQRKHEHQTEPTVAPAAAANRSSGAAVKGDKVKGFGSLRQPSPGASPVAAEPSIEPGRAVWKDTERSDQHISPDRDLRAVVQSKGGIRGQADGQHGKSLARSAKNHGPAKARAESADRGLPRGHTGGDTSVGQFLVRRNSVAGAPKQPAMPRQSSGEGSPSKQSRSAGNFLPRGNSAGDPCPPLSPSRQTGHFITRHNKPPAKPGGGTQNTVPHAPAGPSMSAKERSQAAPVQQTGPPVAKSMALDCQPGSSGKRKIDPAQEPFATVQVRFHHQDPMIMPHLLQLDVLMVSFLQLASACIARCVVCGQPLIVAQVLCWSRGACVRLCQERP